MYWSNRSFNMTPHPPPLPGRTPGIWHLCRPGEEGICLSDSSRGWGIWTAPSISCEISGVASYHGGRGVRLRGFSWKRLCLCGQLVTRRGLKQALCRVWRYLNFKIGVRLWMYECNKLCLQWNTMPIPAKPAACMSIHDKVSDDARQWNGHDIVISVGGSCMTHEERLSWPCSSDFRRFARDFCS